MADQKRPGKLGAPEVGDDAKPLNPVPGGLFWFLGALLIGAALGAGGLTLVNRNRPAPIRITTPAPPATPMPTPSPGPILVHVSGQVIAPDVYELPYGSIVDQAIEAAGGFTANANASAVNLAQRLVDGTQVYVPSLDEAAFGPGTILRTPDTALDNSASGAPAPSGLININTASVDQLDTLPGIGPTLGRRIVDYREINGRFSSVEGIMNVSGIGATTFDKIKELITAE